MESIRLIKNSADNSYQFMNMMNPMNNFDEESEYMDTKTDCMKNSGSYVLYDRMGTTFLQP